MLVLFETAAGFGLFKVNNEGKLLKQSPEDIWEKFVDADTASKTVSLKKFMKFKNTTDAIEATTATIESELGASLKKFLKKEIVDQSLSDKLAVADSKLGGVISKKLGIEVTSDKLVTELMRGIRAHADSLLGDLSAADQNAMALGLSHGLSRYKLKFSPDKVDTMIVQAISLLDDLDKELNTYAMRVREWYGWHFPELTRVIPDQILFAKTVKKMQMRTNAPKTDFSDFLPEEMEAELKEVAKISMGTEISNEDMENISELCDQVIAISAYREQLFEYLKNRMNAIAPNLTVLVGELVGARLISHAGSLLSLAKHPASTVQILGAEKALFRALKTKHATPKYGLIYHASLLGQTTPKNKGKIARLLGAKCALAVRCDALGEGETDDSVGQDGRSKIEARIKSLEGLQAYKLGGTGRTQTNTPKYNKKESAGQERSAYDTTKDSTNGKTPKKEAKKVEIPAKKPKKEESESEEEEKPKKKEVKKSKKEESESEEEKPKKKAAKKSKKEESESEEEEKPKKSKKSKKEDSEDEKPKKKDSKKSKKAESDSEEEKPKKKDDKKKRKQDDSDEEEDKPKKKKK